MPSHIASPLPSAHRHVRHQQRDPGLPPSSPSLSRSPSLRSPRGPAPAEASAAGQPSRLQRGPGPTPPRRSAVPRATRPQSGPGPAQSAATRRPIFMKRGTGIGTGGGSEMRLRPGQMCVNASSSEVAQVGQVCVYAGSREADQLNQAGVCSVKPDRGILSQLHAKAARTRDTRYLQWVGGERRSTGSQLSPSPLFWYDGNGIGQAA